MLTAGKQVKQQRRVNGLQPTPFAQPTAQLPDCSSLTVLVMAEPVSAANVAEWEARKRDIRLKRSSFKHFEDSPSLRARITRSCKVSATHTPVSTCMEVGRERWISVGGGGGLIWPVLQPTDAQAEDVHEHRVAFLRLLVEASRGPNPVQVGSV